MAQTNNTNQLAPGTTQTAAAQIALMAASFKNGGGNYNIEISPTGWIQVLGGNIVTDPNDRVAVANVLGALGNSPAAIAGIRAEMLNNKYSENMPRR